MSGLLFAVSATAVEIGGLGARVQRGLTPPRGFKPDDPRDLDALLEALRDAGQLSGLRPDSEEGRRMVFEFADAVPLSIAIHESDQPMRLWP